MSLRVFTLITATFFTLLFASLAFGQSAAARLGTNLNAVNDYSPQLPFKNLFLNSREWFTQCQVGIDQGCTVLNSWDTHESSMLDFDTDGWVRSLPQLNDAPIYRSVATFLDLPAEFPSGLYVVLYDGKGVIEYGIGARKIQQNSSPGRDVLHVDMSKGGILLRIVETDPQGDGEYLRSIRLVSAEDESNLVAHRFSESFLKRLKPYQVLRFMDWMRTNDSVVSSWTERAKQSDAFYSSAKGVPLEVMLELSNISAKAPWFTLPHRATDDFVRNFAALVRNSLSPDLPVYIEYSNEIWNSGFSQGSWVENQGLIQWPESLESGFTKRINWYARRSSEICQIWKSTFALSEKRVICILASQAANSWTGEQALTCPLWSEGPCYKHGFGALAIAPYFGDYLGQQENSGDVAGWGASAAGLSKLFTELKSGEQLSSGPQGGALKQSFNWIEANKIVAEAFGVALFSYEGGQHLVAVGHATDNSTLTSMFTDANRDERVGDLYSSYLQGWAARGGGLFMHFTDIGSYTKYGSWGALERIGENASAKYNALWSYSLGTEPPPKYTAPPLVPNPSRILKVSKRGRGEVVSSPYGIRCGYRCKAVFSRGARVRLHSRPAASYRLIKWKGACKHNSKICILSMRNSRSVTAIFERRKKRKIA